MQSLTPGVRRFMKYVGFSAVTFTGDLALLYSLTTFAHVPYYISTPIAFFIAVSINYVVSRKFVFKGTARPLAAGYAFFLAFALGGALVVTAAVTALVTYAHLYYLLARIIVALFVGTVNYLLNLRFNFKVEGMHL